LDANHWERRPFNNETFTLSKFQGNDLAIIVINIETATKFLNEKLTQTQEETDLVGGLSLIPGLFRVMTVTHIHDEVQYQLDLKKFNVELKLFYKYGSEIFLKHDETFYFHAFRFYVPKLALLTYERHKLGLGIFSMQGFERRNKESKNTLKQFCTGHQKSPKLLVNNMRRLLQVFLYEMNAYKSE
jgi:hypothetical protein